MEAPELERRLAAILAADVEGYSRLMHGDEEATMATLSARRAVVDELIARHEAGSRTPGPNRDRKANQKADPQCCPALRGEPGHLFAKHVDRPTGGDARNRIEMTGYGSRVCKEAVYRN
jgi:class 3 adenylate cyclase